MHINEITINNRQKRHETRNYVRLFHNCRVRFLRKLTGIYKIMEIPKKNINV